MHFYSLLSSSVPSNHKHMMRPLVIALLLLISTATTHAQINTQRMMEVGRNALYYDDYALSIQYFSRVILAKPYLYEPYFYRGLAKFYLEDYHGAESDLSEAIRINPFYPNSYEVRGLSRINLKKFDLASEDYRQATDMMPESKALWHNWVLCNIQLDSLQRADSISSAFIRRWPRYADGYTLKAQILMQEGDTIQAECYLDTALVNDPYSVTPLSIKAAMCMTREEWNKADSLLTKALRGEPRNTHNIINRALARYHINNLRGAMADYDMALDIDPTNFIGHYNRGLLRTNVGEDNAAIEDFDFILRIDPNDVMAIYNRAELRMRTGDYRGAVADYTKLIRTYPNFLTGYSRRAEARRRAGDKRGAAQDEDHILREQIAHRFGYSTPATRQGVKTRRKSDVNLEEYQKLVVDDEDNSKNYEGGYRGKIQNQETALELQAPLSLPDYRQKEAPRDESFANALEHLVLGENEQALAGFDHVIEQNSRLPEAYYNRAYALAKLHRNQAAKEDLDKAIKLDPDLAPARYNRGIILILLGEKEQAIPDLSKAGELGIYQAYSVIKHHTR